MVVGGCRSFLLLVTTGITLRLENNFQKSRINYIFA